MTAGEETTGSAKPLSAEAAKALTDFASQAVEDYKEKLKREVQDRINKVTKERLRTSPAGDANLILYGHKMEGIQILKLIDSIK